MNKQAFSLVELMVVIAIIGVLSAIAVPSYKNYITKARIAELLAIAANIQVRIAEKYNTGVSWNSLGDLGLTSTATNYVSSFDVADVTAACPIGAGTVAGVIYVTGNATTIGVSGNIQIIKVACVNNDIINWVCGYPADMTAANVAYLPSNCQNSIEIAE